MKEEFEQALSNANFRAILDNQKEKLKDKLKADFLIPYNGGYFEIGPLLFSEIQLYLNENKNRVTLLDMYLNPIEINDLADFYKSIRYQYTEAINVYRMELNKLTKNRDVKKLVQYDLEKDIEE